MNHFKAFIKLVTPFVTTGLFKEVVFKFIDQLEGFMKDSPSLLRVGIGCKLFRDTRWKGGEVVDHFI